MLEFIKQLAVDAGKLALERRQTLTESGIYAKGTDVDMVTDVDRETEAFIISKIQANYPEHGIFGEESGIQTSDSPYRWVIDPIDGTVSFIHDTHYWCVSIALQKDGETIAGAIYAPKLDELFYAEKGKGAFLNGREIHVSSCNSMLSAVLATGFACVRARQKPDNMIYFAQILRQAQGVRRGGSAALDLCHVAAGRYDGYWEMKLNLYDIAAGALIAAEAGAVVCDFKNKQNFPDDGIICVTPGLFDKLMYVIEHPQMEYANE